MKTAQELHMLEMQLRSLERLPIYTGLDLIEEIKELRKDNNRLRTVMDDIKRGLSIYADGRENIDVMILSRLEMATEALKESK